MAESDQDARVVTAINRPVTIFALMSRSTIIAPGKSVVYNGPAGTTKIYEEKHMNVEEGEKRLYKRRITVRKKAFAKH